MSTAYTAGRTALRTAGIMTVFTIAFTALMAYTHQLTGPTIEASTRAEQLRLVNEILPPGSYDNDLLADRLPLGPTPALGLDEGGQLYRARRGGEPVAVVLEAVAPDGYSGRIQLVIAVGADGVLRGVRVTAHKETPGLGDYIDPAKDKNKQTPWIAQFAGLPLDQPGERGWTVRKDGGHFDYRTGATISARAVSRAVGRAVAHVRAQGPALYAPAPEKRP